VILRKIGKSIVGKSTPFPLIAGCTLGAMLGFVPGILQAPLLFAMLLAAIAILNTNLWLAALMTLGAKVASVALLPVSHAIGTVLLDGPTQPLFQAVVNAPVLAYCGFEHYTVTGGMFLGAVGGCGIGFLLCRAVKGLRTRFIELSDSSEKFATWSNKRSVRLLSWLVIGMRPDRDAFEKLNQKKVGRPVRPLGLAFAGLLAVLAFVLPQFFSGPIMTNFIRTQLEKMNGATVDLALAEFGLDGRLTLNGLAIADPEDLDRDRFRCEHLEADISTTDLLRKRLHIERVIIVEAVSDVPRSGPPARRTKPEVLPEDVAYADSVPGADSSGDGTAPEGAPIPMSLEEVLEDIGRWRGELEKIDRQVDTVMKWTGVAGGLLGGDDDGERGPEVSGRSSRPRSESARARATADHLIEDVPTLRVDELRIERLEAMQWDGTPLAVEVRNFSTHPHLLAGAPEVTVRTLDDRFRASLVCGSITAEGGENRVELSILDIPADAIAAELVSDDGPLIRGGAVDIETTGGWTATAPLTLDLPVRVRLRDSEIRIPGIAEAEPVEKLELGVGIAGPLLAPRITIDERALVDALVAAGKAELARRVEARIAGHVDEAKARLEEEKARARAEVDAEAERAKEKLRAEAERKLRERTGGETEELEKAGGDLLRGILGGSREKDPPPPEPQAEPDDPR
jgi:uncharacterized protein (TIGR03546 family)